MAAKNHIPIKNIDTNSSPCTISVRIIRLWKQPTYGNTNNIGSIEMILMDKEAERIQASVRKTMIPNFENMLIEGEAISISNFFVAQNVGSYKVLDHPFKINLHKMSSVKKLDTFYGPSHGFKFARFADIVDGKIENNQTVDVIGHVSGFGDVVTGEKNGVPNKRMDVLLQDIDGIKVKCTFWDAYVDDFKAKFSDDKSDVNVLVIQFAKIREWRGNFTVSHGFHVARLFLNNQIHEINAFKRRFVEKHGDETANLKIISLPDPSTEAFFGNSKCIALDDLDSIYEPTSCVAVATIKSIEAAQPWFYIACRKCNKKVITKNPDDEIEVVDAVSKTTQTTHDCPECGPDVSVIPRFKVQVKVVDDSGEASLVLFDRDVVKLIMKTAHNLREKCVDNEDYPADLDAMIGKKLMFKFDLNQFNLKHNYQVYTVSRMTENEIMFTAFFKLRLIELEFQTQAEKAKATECFADAMDATNTIIGEHSGDAQGDDGERDPKNVGGDKTEVLPNMIKDCSKIYHNGKTAIPTYTDMEPFQKAAFNGKVADLSLCTHEARWVVKMIRIPSSTLIIYSREKDDMSFPDEFLPLIGEKMLFRLALRLSNIESKKGPYCVSTISTNSSLISALKDSFEAQKEYTQDVRTHFE